MSAASGVSTASRLSRSGSIASIATSDAFDDGSSCDEAEEEEPQLLVRACGSTLMAYTCKLMLLLLICQTCGP